jgi:hypothetical protein
VRNVREGRVMLAVKGEGRIKRKTCKHCFPFNSFTAVLSS